MNSSNDTDISAQTSQLRSATFQHGSTRSYQNPTRASSNFILSPVVSLQSLPTQFQGTLQPLSYSELIERTKHHWQSLRNESKPLKDWLRLAESIRRDAKIFHEQDDLESAFVEYTKTSIIVHEKIPAHPDYRVLLSAKYRRNIGLHGQEIVDSLADIKISTMTRYEQWRADPSSMTNTSSSVPISNSLPESANCPPDSGLAVAASASESSGLITGHLQMPLQSTRYHPENPNKIPRQPVTTTSPLPPQLGTAQFSSLMSQHQISQGYHPSLGSMFHRQSHTTYSTPHGYDHVAHNLKTVSFPHDCMNWFTSIASINTAKNRETRGLLLGKDKGGRYVVTTLLIPKQYATSDTCAIVEEELVTQFTEERSLITLGWIHTHPTQSCFMSSVDLHTHSRFQRMLPESFVVVCAPNSTPNFGIFRLTDPSGLQTILQCTALATFHPHPDQAMYTDADKGHVQIRGLLLEIIDLREHTASESMYDSIALPSRRRAIALPPENTPEVVKGSSSGYRRSKAGRDGEGDSEEEEIARAPRTASLHNEPTAELETPKQRPVALHPTKTPAQRSNVSRKSTLSSVNHSDGIALSTDTSMQSEAAANPTSEVFEGFDMLHRPPGSQLHDQQPEYLRILRDKFGTPRPDRGNRHSFTDYNSSRNEGGGNYRESFVDPDNESSNVRCSVKTVSKGSLLSPSILSPVSSQLTSRFN